MYVWPTETPEENLLTDASSLEYRGLVARLQRQMIALLPRYCLAPNQLKLTAPASQVPQQINLPGLCFKTLYI